MKIIIAGSRDITSVNEVGFACFKSGLFAEATEIISGGAKGVDSLGEVIANMCGLPVKQFIPDWTKYGKKAGFLRNIEMAEYADALIAVWDGNSRGTQHMIDIAKAKGLKVFVHIVENKLDNAKNGGIVST